MSWYFRVSPHLTLQALREHLGEFLGEDAVAEKFLYLKCIGNNLAVVSFFFLMEEKPTLTNYVFLKCLSTQLLNVLWDM